MNSLIERKAKTLLARVMGTCERQFGTRLDECVEERAYSIKGSNLALLRDDILNAYNDFLRSVSLEPKTDGRITFTPGIMVLLQKMEFGIKNNAPFISIRSETGDLASITILYRQIGDGIVYTDKGCPAYICRGIESMVQKIIPIIDSAIIANIRFNHNQYREWRDKVRNIYIGEA